MHIHNRLDIYTHSANSFYETSIPRGNGVHTVRILQDLQGFVLNFDFGIYLDYMFSRHLPADTSILNNMRDR